MGLGLGPNIDTAIYIVIFPLEKQLLQRQCQISMFLLKYGAHWNDGTREHEQAAVSLCVLNRH